jgi:hypothetical protein
VPSAAPNGKVAKLAVVAAVVVVAVSAAARGLSAKCSK